MLSPLAPLKTAAWDYPKAAHLLNRAGFGGSPGEVETLFCLGLDGAVESLLCAPEDSALFPRPGWAQPRNLVVLQQERKALKEDAKIVMRRQAQKRDRQLLGELVEWWMRRMRQTPNPLQEKLTLFWHGHFATSAQKVRDPYYLWLQNETLRRHAFGNFSAMLQAILRDPAMLIWLDGDKSLSYRPNENFAREMLELFTLGVGNYTEEDVQAAARAFTGYRINPADQSFRFAPLQHDDAEKSFLGRKGAFDGDAIIAILLEQPACARFIARKLCAFFAYGDPSPAMVSSLAEELTRSGYEMRPVLRVLFRSEEFYSKRAMRTQIKSPTQWLVSLAKMLETDLPRRGAMVGILRELGQVPFMPPNVAGWDGGKAWITTATLLARYNFTATLTGNRAVGARVLRAIPQDLRGDPEAVVDALALRLFQAPITPRETASFVDFLQNKTITEASVAELMRLMMSTPQFQLA